KIYLRKRKKNYKKILNSYTMTKKLSLSQKSEIAVHLRNKVPQAKIAKSYNVSQAAISKIAIKIKEYGTVDRKRGSERPSIFSAKAMKFLKDRIKTDPKIGSNKLSAELLINQNISVSPRTIRSKLSSIGLKGRTACCKPLLTKKHAASRNISPKSIYHGVIKVGIR
ncbi:hypothetical protein DMUE_6069, partial [Dictyocoela muelleri]